MTNYILQEKSHDEDLIYKWKTGNAEWYVES